jgi:Tfp pilus assembly PilM family ATPase
LLPRKRLLAIDPGSHGVKLLLMEEMLGHTRILRHELIEIQGGGLVPEEEVLRQAQDVVQELGQDPVALALPHYRTLSQVVDLPPSEPAEVRRLIEEESVKLSGLGESSIVHDYVALKPFGRHHNPFWVTLCREDEVQKQVDRCGLTNLDLCEVSTTANALAAAFLASEPEADCVVLVDFGATGTVVVILYQGQAVDAGHFALGGDALTEALAAQHCCSFEVAENAKRSQDLGGPPEDTAPLTAVLGTWQAEVQRAVTDWLQEHADLGLSLESFRVVLCGGASLQPGLLAHLNQGGPLRFSLWPEVSEEGWPGARFAGAYGVALQYLGRSRQSVSLLPAHVRQFWRGHHSLSLLHSLIVFLVAMLALVVGLGTWQKYEGVRIKENLLKQSRSALEKALNTEDLARELHQQYTRLRPLLERQRQTLDLLQTLNLLQQVRSNQSYWFVLLADQRSYVSARPWGDTNPPPSPTTLPPAPLAAREAFVAELCVTEEGDAMRRTLSQLVAALKASRFYQNVDSLPDDRRRRLVDPAVTIPDRHFALALEMPPDRLPSLAPLPERRSPPSAPLSPRRLPADEARGGERATNANHLRQP